VLITETNSIDKPGPRVIFANSAFERMTGYKAIDILGKSPRLLQGKETNSNSSQQIRQALLKWKPIRIELTNYRKNQETFRVELNIAPGADETGWWTHWIAIQRDINEEMHKSRLLALGELAAGIGHEINNPLAIANGYVERIRVYLKNTNTVIPQIEEYIQKYMLASNRISIIVKGMRNLARKEVLELQQINAREAIEECLSLVAENFNQQGINIKNELCSEVAWILGDSGRLQQCLLNLLTNSRDSVLLGPIKQIIVKLEIIKDEVIFRVIDSGTGISKSDQFKIFQPFFTTKPVGKGTGIGLSTVFSMIHEMNGKIEFENLKSGVEFRLTFPLLKSDKIKK
jgi:PAS domain S-box-containing protein